MWEVSNGADVSLALSDGITGDFKACKFDLVLSEAKLLQVEGDPMSATGIQPLCSLEEAFFDRVRP